MLRREQRLAGPPCAQSTLKSIIRSNPGHQLAVGRGRCAARRTRPVIARASRCAWRAAETAPQQPAPRPSSFRPLACKEPCNRHWRAGSPRRPWAAAAALQHGVEGIGACDIDPPAARSPPALAGRDQGAIVLAGHHAPRATSSLGTGGAHRSTGRIRRQAVIGSSFNKSQPEIRGTRAHVNRRFAPFPSPFPAPPRPGFTGASPSFPHRLSHQMVLGARLFAQPEFSPHEIQSARPDRPSGLGTLSRHHDFRAAKGFWQAIGSLGQSATDPDRHRRPRMPGSISSTTRRCVFRGPSRKSSSARR